MTEDKKLQLLNATTKKELEEIVAVFNLDIAKKNLLRSSVYSDLVDKVIAEMGDRIDKVPGQFSNKELLDYVSVLQAQLTKSSAENKEIPTIAIQQNIVNVNSQLNQFDRESKDRMRDALKSILSKGNIVNQDFTDVIIDTEEGSIEERNSFDGV